MRRFVCCQGFKPQIIRASSMMCTASGSTLTQFKLISTCSHHILACLCERIGSICVNNRPIGEFFSSLLPGRRCPPSLFMGPDVNADVVTPLTLRFSSLSPPQLKSSWPTRDTLCPRAAVRWDEETWLASCCLWSAATPGSRAGSPSPPNEKRRREEEEEQLPKFTFSSHADIYSYFLFRYQPFKIFDPPLQYSRGQRKVFQNIHKSNLLIFSQLISSPFCLKPLCLIITRHK